MNEKQRTLDVLNSMEVFESNGGEEAYILVENNEENQELLKEVGISLETALRYGDEETFCILALAFGEGYADLYDGNKLIAFEEKFEVELGRGQTVVFYKNKGENYLSVSEVDGHVWTKKLSAEQLKEICNVIA